MEFRILGAIEVRNEAGAVALGGKKPRAVLAVLLLHANEPVSAERLALALWGDDVPGSAVKTVQVHVSRLRKALGDPDAIATTAAGYRLRVGPGELDAERFERLVDQGRTALADGQPEHASSLLRGALMLWRGSPLAELADEPFAAAEIARLEEQRLATLEARVEADLAAGRHEALVGELAQLVGDHPIRERLAGQLMLALYRCGRQAEALEAYARARSVLVAEIGVEPGPDLRRLQEAILRQDESLQPQAVGSRLPPELDAAAALPLAGRDRERAWIAEHWKRANEGAGALVAIVGPRGIGKSRLAAEVAGERHRAGATVLYVTATAPVDASLDTLARVREVEGPTLVVVDDADRGGEELGFALDGLARQVAERPVLVLATGENADALTRLGVREILALKPLSASAIASIALDYAPNLDYDDLPVEWLVKASAGIPRRAHEVASQWARREAARRVGAVAGRAAGDRAQLREVESELADDVAQLQAAEQRAGHGGDDAGPVVCPFKGLASFDVGDAPYFHGRERLTAQLVARLVGAGLLAIVGPSGSGKSSVMRAGLLPALASGVLPGSERWEQVLIRPGAHPLRELEAALPGGEGQVVIAVDQFEETFTACADESERRAFVQALVGAASGRDARCVVVLALRADFYGRCAAYDDLAGLLAANHVLVGPMSPEELRRAIEGPAQRARLRIDSELTDALVRDVAGEPGGLPLLSTALLELWQRRDGRRLSLAAYERTGGVHGAVSRLAEEAFGQLRPPQQRVARGVLMRLVGEGAAGGIERRRVPLEELETMHSQDVARVVALLTDRRLVTVGVGFLELAHEALLREWPRLQGWIEEDRDGLRIQRNLSAAAQEWSRLSRDEGALYRGGRLLEATEWADLTAGGGAALSDLERDFLAAGEAGRRRETATRRRRAVLAFSSLVVMLVAISIVAIVSISQSHEARRQRDGAASRELAARAADLIDSDPGLSRLVALAAYKRRDTPQAEAAVRQATLADRTLAMLPADAADVSAIAPSADGRRIATGGSNGSVRLWDVRRRRLVATIRAKGESVRSVDLSRDGAKVAWLTQGGSVTIAGVDGSDRRVLLTIPTGPSVSSPGSVQFSSNGRHLLVGGQDGTVRLVDVATRTWRLVGRHAKAVWSARFNPAGTKVVSAGADERAVIWDLATGASRNLPHAGTRVFDATFSPDGRHVATASEDGKLRLWDAGTGRLEHAPLAVAADNLDSVRYDREGRRLVTAAGDGRVRVLDVRAWRALDELRGHIGGVYAAAFVGAADAVVSGGEDGTLRFWGPPATRTVAGQASLASFSTDGRHVIWSEYTGGGVHRWDTVTGRDRTLAGLTATLGGVARESGDRSRVVSASLDGSVRVSDASGRGAHRVPTDTTNKFAVAIDRTGAQIAYGGAGPAEIQTLASGTRVKTRGQGGEVFGLAFSPDGRHLASASTDGVVRIFSTATGRREQLLRGHADTVTSVAYSPDGDRLVTAGTDATIRIWPLHGGSPLILVGHRKAVQSAEFNARGDRIVSASQDGTVRIWDAANGAPLVTVTAYGSAGSAGFGPRGNQIVSAGDDPAGSAVRVASCDVCGAFDDALRLARSRPSRPLDATDRRQLLADGPF